VNKTCLFQPTVGIAKPVKSRARNQIILVGSKPRSNNPTCRSVAPASHHENFCSGKSLRACTLSQFAPYLIPPPSVICIASLLRSVCSSCDVLQRCLRGCFVAPSRRGTFNFYVIAASNFKTRKVFRGYDAKLSETLSRNSPFPADGFHA